MYNPLISIIIPTYNVESYIGRCLDSCINQTLGDIEIIVVDDCGSDDSIKIAKEYAKKDFRIRIIYNQSNLGLFSARIQGERVAKGAYILPLDADDYISIFTCKILYHTLYNLHTTPLQILKLFKNLLLGNGGGGIMENNPFISIIIPVYNVRAYLSRCLESCINQTLSDIEILVIDDCGSDGAIHIAKAYAKIDSRIKIIHNEKNVGTFAARIKGMQEANGVYIAFLDADDYLDIKACEKSYQAILESLKKQDAKNVQNLNLKDMYSQDSHNQTISAHIALQSLQTPLQESLEVLPDIIHFKSHYTANKQANLLASFIHYTRYILPTRFCKQPLYNEQIANNFFLSSTEFPKFTLWDKCYKTSLIKKVVPFVEKLMPLKLIMAEDMLKFFVISAFAKSYVSVNSRLYFYCLNHSSITQNPQAKQKKIADMRHISEALHSLGEDLKAYNPLMPFIAQVMSKNLAALIILESRFLENKGGVDSILAPLQSLIESALIPLPKIPRYIRFIHSPYVLCCLLSLQYWNRSLTYIRLIVYILSFTLIKL